MAHSGQKMTKKERKKQAEAAPRSAADVSAGSSGVTAPLDEAAEEQRLLSVLTAWACAAVTIDDHTPHPFEELLTRAVTDRQLSAMLKDRAKYASSIVPAFTKGTPRRF